MRRGLAGLKPKTYTPKPWKHTLTKPDANLIKKNETRLTLKPPNPKPKTSLTLKPQPSTACTCCCCRAASYSLVSYGRHGACDGLHLGVAPKHDLGPQGAPPYVLHLERHLGQVEHHAVRNVLQLVACGDVRSNLGAGARGGGGVSGSQGL